MVFAGALALVAVLAFTLSLLNGPSGFESCSGVFGCGWIIPLAAALLIGAVLWVLSVQRPVYRDDGGRAEETSCGECGDRVMRDWRLCPTCGTRLGD